MDKGFVPYSTDEYKVTSDRDFQPELLFHSFRKIAKYIVCDVCGRRSLSFESTSVLYITPTNNASAQELVWQDHKQKLYKNCFRCKKDTWCVEFKHLLQPSMYLAITVNSFNYTNNIATKDRNLIPLDLNTMLGSYKFNI